MSPWLCEHGKLSVDAIRSLKRVNAEAYNIFKATYGSEKDVTDNSLCRKCVYLYYLSTLHSFQSHLFTLRGKCIRNRRGKKEGVIIEN